MSPFRLVTALAISAALLTGANAQSAGPTAASDSQQIEGIAAIVNDEPVSYSDVRQRARMLLLGLGTQPTQQDIQRITGQALQQLIDEKLQLQEASEYELVIDPAEVRAEIGELAAQSGLSEEEFYTQLISAGINPTSLQEQVEAETAWRRIMSGLYGSRIRISNNQIQDRLEQLRASSRETQFLVSEIFLYAPDEESKTQAREAAASIRDQLIEGAPFPVAAQRFSSAPTSATGGDMGWISLDDLDPESSAALIAMDGPGITEPVTVADGVYIFAVRSRQEPGETDTQVTLKRVLTRSSDRDSLSAISSEISGCDGLETLAEGRSDLEVADLGRISLSQLAEDAAARLQETPANSATEIFESAGGLAVMVVCSRTDSIGNLPSEEQIENQLFGQQLSMISDRALRNLRREATIIQRD
ncbi:MAG: peptidylprolyl isomerase [Pseudomonadota bacterium]